ncbi:MAG TPA: hypothetical protein VNE18_10300 [Rhodanobacter sp.]|nr:hypothetical protein [Rhodanobacter sp.]
MNIQTSEVEREVKPNMGALATITRAEIDQQIATAHAYPRSVKRFLDEARDMATLTEEIAAGCIYALPRDGKTIEGPSARFAEIAASAWGNCRAGARVIGEDAEFVTAQGVFHDLERNVAITYEVKRRITDKHGKRYKADMIGVTSNAACSIALRNAVLKGIPKSFWNEIYNDARRVIVGDSQTLANRRAQALDFIQKFGITQDQVLMKLGRNGAEDITGDDLVVLRGLATALREGDTTVEEAFGVEPAGGRSAGGLQAYSQQTFDANFPTWEKHIKDGRMTAANIIAKLESKAALTAEQKKKLTDIGVKSKGEPA